MDSNSHHKIFKSSYFPLQGVGPEFFFLCSVEVCPTQHFTQSQKWTMGSWKGHSIYTAHSTTPQKGFLVLVNLLLTYDTKVYFLYHSHLYTFTEGWIFKLDRVTMLITDPLQISSTSLIKVFFYNIMFTFIFFYIFYIKKKWKNNNNKWDTQNMTANTWHMTCVTWQTEGRQHCFKMSGS